MAQQDKHEALNALIEEIFQTNGMILLDGDRLSAAQGLTAARWQVLGALDLEQRPLTVAQIARRMGLQRQSVQRLADILVEQGLLAYHPNPEHKRAKLVDFTAKGSATIREMDAIQRSWAEQILPDFSSAELQQTVAVLKKLRHKIDRS